MGGISGVVAVATPDGWSGSMVHDEGEPQDVVPSLLHALAGQVDPTEYLRTLFSSAPFGWSRFPQPVRRPTIWWGARPMVRNWPLVSPSDPVLYSTPWLYLVRNGALEIWLRDVGHPTKLNLLFETVDLQTQARRYGDVDDWNGYEWWHSVKDNLEIVEHRSRPAEPASDLETPNPAWANPISRAVERARLAPHRHTLDGLLWIDTPAVTLRSTGDLHVPRQGGLMATFIMFWDDHGTPSNVKQQPVQVANKVASISRLRAYLSAHRTTLQYAWARVPPETQITPHECWHPELLDDQALRTEGDFVKALAGPRYYGAWLHFDAHD